MTTNKISQIAALMKGTSEFMTKDKVQETDAAFGALLNQTSGKDAKQDLFSMGGNLQSSLKPGTDNQAVMDKAFVQTGYRGASVKQNDDSNIQDKLPPDTSEKLKGFEEKVTEKLSEKLGISEEEVEEQMAAMGLTVLDLTDASKLADLVMELTGSDDIAGLLLSEDFQQILGDLGELAQDLMTELNLTPEEMKQFTEQLEAMIPDGKEADVQQSSESSETETLPLADGYDMAQDVMDSETEQDVLSGQNAGTLNTASKVTVKEQETVTGQESAENMEYSENDELTTVTDVQENNPEQDEASEENSNTRTKSHLDLEQTSKSAEKPEAGQTHVTYQTTAQNVNQGQIEITQTVVQARVDVEDIIRQVSQMTRVVINQAESSIEMQLNPANLGKIYLQVVSREGVVTAQLAAQNEAVKQALENQIAILKENMNQQGLKVEAIEVTVASHEFERNLEENQQNAAREQQNEDARRSSRRNINLNSMDEPEGQMPEEDSLVAKMMSEQGNSVDLTA